MSNFEPTNLFSELVENAAGSFFEKVSNVAFAQHTFKTSEVDPHCATQVMTQIEYIEKYLRGSTISEINKGNPYLGVVASPGCGKSHLLDWLDQTAVSTERQVLRLTFSSKWKILSNEDSWTMEQRVVGRLLCIDYGCTEWGVFSSWFQQSPLFTTSFLQLFEYLKMKSNKTILLLVDEILLYTDQATSFSEFVALIGFLYNLSDTTLLFPNKYSPLIPFITSLHYSYCIEAVISTRCRIVLFGVDKLPSHQVMNVFEAFYDVHGKKTVQCLVNMCMGHARSIEYVFKTLRSSHGADSFSSIVLAVYRALSTTSIFAKLENNVRLVLPVVLDLHVYSSLPKAEIVPTTTAGDKIIDGSRMVFGGVYANSLIAIADSFMPSMTIWHLVALCEDQTACSDDELECWPTSLFNLVQSFGCTTKESFETYTSRALHVRFESLRYLNENRNVCRETFSYAPLVSVFSDSHKKCGNIRPLIPITRQSHVYNVGNEDIRQWRLVLTDQESIHTKTTTFPSGFFDSNNDYVCDFFSSGATGFIRPTNLNDAAVDIGARLWCKNKDDPSVFAMNLFIQNKFGAKSLVELIQLRSYLNKLQLAADEFMDEMKNQGHDNEKIVLCVAAYGTDGCGIQGRNTSDFSSDFQYTENGTVKKYPPVRYPVILLGNSITSLLGSSFSEFFEQLFDLKDDKGHHI